MNLTERQKCAEHFYNKTKNCLDFYGTDVLTLWKRSQIEMESLCSIFKCSPPLQSFPETYLSNLCLHLITIAKHDGLADIDPFIDNALAEMARKGQDYAADENAYQHFEETAELLGLTVPQVIMVFMLKHWAAITKFRDGKAMQGDPIVTKFMDVCNYCAILDAWLREQSA